MSESYSRAASRRGRTLKLYLVDGSPSGVKTAELDISSVLLDWRHEASGQAYGDCRKRKIAEGEAV